MSLDLLHPREKPRRRAPARLAEYSAARMGIALARVHFDDCLCAVDNCGWTGAECDLLVVDRKLHVIDVEIKITRADLKRDRAKAKWYAHGYKQHEDEAPVQWPRKVWRHFYAVPAPMWDDELFACISPASGVLAVEGIDGAVPAKWRVRQLRKAATNPDYERLDSEQLARIARLTSLRLWDEYQRRGL